MAESQKNCDKNLGTVRGRPFARGNPGRPPGSKNRATLAAEKLLDHEEELFDTALRLARRGNIAMLAILLKPLLPRGRLLAFDLPPVEHADDVVAAFAKIASETAAGRMSPEEGSAMASQVSWLVKGIELTDVVKRLDRLEALVAESLGS